MSLVLTPKVQVIYAKDWARKWNETAGHQADLANLVRPQFSLESGADAGSSETSGNIVSTADMISVGTCGKRRQAILQRKVLKVTMKSRIRCFTVDLVVCPEHS